MPYGHRIAALRAETASVVEEATVSQELPPASSVLAASEPDPLRLRCFVSGRRLTGRGLEMRSGCIPLSYQPSSDEETPQGLINFETQNL